jgi:hypothetical protein
MTTPNPPFARQGGRRRRRGVASMLAMLYLVLFAVLAVGFYATSAVSTQVSYNERRSIDTQLAAETGVNFIRNALYQIQIPARTTPANVLAAVCADLEDLLNGTGNLGSNQVDMTGSNKIEIPAGSNKYIEIGNGQRFRVEIQRDDGLDGVSGTTSDDLSKLVVTVTGMGLGTAERSRIRVTFARKEAPTGFFRNGMVSAGQVQILTKNLVQGLPAGHAKIITLSTVNPPITIGTVSGTSYGGVAGDLYVPEGTVPTVYPNWSVGGTTNQIDITTNHIHKMAAEDMPPLPVPVTSIYQPFATNTYVSGQLLYKNIVIPPNTNPTFNGPVTIQGVVYIKQPNKVSFAGQCEITGVIVGENTGVGTLLSNAVIFSGNGGVKAGVEALPDDPEFAGLKQLPGSFIVAPGFDVQLTGNFGAISGHITGDKVTVSGASSSSITGSLVALKSTLTIGGNTNATLIYDTNQSHAGLRVEDRYEPVFTTYDEIK